MGVFPMVKAKLPTVGSKSDMNPDWYMFKRRHTGQLVSSGRALQALWPILIAGLTFLVFGALLITRAANGGVALGGACLALIGISFVAAFSYLLTKESK